MHHNFKNISFIVYHVGAIEKFLAKKLAFLIFGVK